MDGIQSIMTGDEIIMDGLGEWRNHGGNENGDDMAVRVDGSSKSGGGHLVAETWKTSAKLTNPI